MLTNSSFAPPLLALAAALVATPLAADQPVLASAEHGTVHREDVTFADLDLRDRSAQQILRRRVYRAAHRVCDKGKDPYPSQVRLYGRSLSCADLTFNAARPQIRAAIDRASSGQQLAAMTLVISAPAAR